MPIEEHFWYHGWMSGWKRCSNPKCNHYIHTHYDSETGCLGYPRITEEHIEVDKEGLKRIKKEYTYSKYGNCACPLTPEEVILNLKKE